MDEVDYKYKNSIREALQEGNVDRVMELVPELELEEAENYVNEWKENYEETMSNIRNSLDTMFLEEKTHKILNELMERAHLSGYHK